jgi:hypothetical protein
MTPFLFRQMLDTLGEAQGQLQADMEQLRRAEAPDAAVLLRLSKLARDCQEQAHSLLVSMLYQQSVPELVVETEAYVSFFSSVLDEIAGGNGCAGS